MPWATVVDLTGSDDDDGPRNVSSTLGRAQQTGSASVLAAALTRAGRETCAPPRARSPRLSRVYNNMSRRFSGTSAGERSPVGTFSGVYRRYINYARKPPTAGGSSLLARTPQNQCYPLCSNYPKLNSV